MSRKTLKLFDLAEKVAMIRRAVVEYITPDSAIIAISLVRPKALRASRKVPWRVQSR